MEPKADNQLTIVNQADSRSKSLLAATGVLVALADQFGRQFKPDTMAMMAEGLAQDLTPEQITAAGRRGVLECKFFPSVAELREFAGAGPVAAKETESAEAVQAWEVCVGWVRRNAWRTRSPESGHIAESVPGVEPLPDRILAAVRYAGGLTQVYLSLATGEGLQWLRKAFVDRFVMEPAIQRLPSADGEALELAERTARRLSGGVQ